MLHSAVYIVVVLAGLIIGLASAQETLVQQPPQPVIYGEANGMTVVAQNDTVAYVASKTPSPLLDKPGLRGHILNLEFLPIQSTF